MESLSWINKLSYITDVGTSHIAYPESRLNSDRATYWYNWSQTVETTVSRRLKPCIVQSRRHYGLDHVHITRLPVLVPVLVLQLALSLLPAVQWIYQAAFRKELSAESVLHV